MAFGDSAALGTFIGGLGLFFTGIRSLSAHMLHLGGRTLRLAIAAHGRNRLLVALSGTLAGAFLQSASGVTFILVSMVTAGLLPVDSALSLLAWANLGTTVLVALSATVSLHAPILLTLGIAGIWLFFDRNRTSAPRQIAEAFLAVALLFLGLEFLREAIAQLRGIPEFTHLIAWVGTSGLASFVAGVLVTLVTQSFTTTAILAVATAQAGLLTFDDALLLVLGAGIGAGLSILMISSGIRGSHRQLILFQVVNRCFGVSLVSLLLLVEHVTGWPLLLHEVRSLSSEVGRELSLIYLACQVGSLAGWYLLRRPFLRFLASAAPPLAVEALAETKFIAETPPVDPDLALTLATKEQARLAEHLFAALQRVDEDSERAFAMLCGKIADFLIMVLRGAEQDADPLTPPQLDRLVNLQARNETLRLEHETLCQIVRLRTDLAAGEAAALAETLTEGLGAVLMWASDSAQSGATEDLEVLHQITSSRSSVVDTLRRSLLHVEEQDIVYTLTSLFERAVWLLQRYAQLLGPSTPAAPPDAAPGVVEPIAQL